MAVIEHNAITGLEGGYQIDNDGLVADFGYLSQVNATFLAKTSVDQFLVIDTAEPAGVHAAGERHFHLVFGLAEVRCRRRLLSGYSRTGKRFAINPGDVRHVFGCLKPPLNLQG